MAVMTVTAQDSIFSRMTRPELRAEKNRILATISLVWDEDVSADQIQSRDDILALLHRQLDSLNTFLP
jgi:hypothetical protein